MLPELGGERLPTRVFISTYHDTPDLRLARHGVTFRHRVEDGSGPVAAEAAARTRPGWSSSSPGRRRGPRPSWSRCCRRTSAAPRSCPSRACAPAGRGSTPAAPRSSTTASPCSRASASRAASGRSRSSCSTATSERCAGSRRSCAGPAPDATGELQPKLYRALDLAAAGRASGRARRSTPPGEALGIALEAEYRALLAHDPGTRRGDDPEDLHQLRVATRRLRAFLRAARPLVEQRMGRRRSARSSAGSAGTSARRATSTSCSAGCGRRSPRSATTPRRRRACSTRSRRSARPPTAMSSRRSAAIATSRCSTGSRPRRRRR